MPVTPGVNGPEDKGPVCRGEVKGEGETRAFFGCMAEVSSILPGLGLYVEVGTCLYVLLGDVGSMLGAVPVSGFNGNEDMSRAR